MDYGLNVKVLGLVAFGLSFERDYLRVNDCLVALPRALGFNRESL